MPLIQELPLTTPRTAQPGWAYIPADTTLPSAQHPTSRKRARLNPTTNNPTATAAAHLTTTLKQQKAIDIRLRDLEKENYKDVHVAIPRHDTPGGDASGRRDSRKTTTSNVRRILGYSRNFNHYLADEEAALAAGQGEVNAILGQFVHGLGAGQPPVQQQQKEEVGRRKSSMKYMAAREKAQEKEKAVKEEQVEVNADAMDVDATNPIDSATTVSPPSPPPDPLLTTSPAYRPLRIPPSLITSLLLEPPLSFSAARAQPLEPEKTVPPRHFCVICGYWGKVKCRRCGERTCGVMECWRGHEGMGCGGGVY